MRGVQGAEHRRRQAPLVLALQGDANVSEGGEAMTDTAKVKCALCEEEVEADNFCHGCRNVVCDQHRAAWGHRHSLDDHEGSNCIHCGEGHDDDECPSMEED